VASRIEGLARLKAKLERIPAQVKTAAKGALVQNQEEFATRLAGLIGRGDPARGHLADSIEKGNGLHELSLTVSLGNVRVPYPAHLEFGHKAPDGSHVPAKPAFYPLLRISRKKFDARVMRAARKAIKAMGTTR